MCLGEIGRSLHVAPTWAFSAWSPVQIRVSERPVRALGGLHGIDATKPTTTRPRVRVTIMKLDIICINHA
jgi:hypothetical protein